MGHAQHLRVPIFQAEWWVGGHNIEMQQAAIVIQQFGVANGVAPFNAVVVFAMQKHVHFGK